MNVDFFQKKHYNLTINLKKDLNMKNGSKLLWSLLVQGAVIGSVLAYKKIKGDKTSSDDLGSSIDEMEKKDAEKVGKAQPNAENTSAENTSSKVSVKDLINQINSASSKSQEVLQKTANIIDKVLTEISGETEPQAEVKKSEAPKPQAPVSKSQPQAEAKKPEAPKPQASVSKSQPQAEVKKAQEPVTKTKSVQELNNDLLNQIKVYKPDAEVVATETPVEAKMEKEVVQKNKVNLPKPETAKPQAKKSPAQEGKSTQAKKATAKDGQAKKVTKATKAAKPVVESDKK